eukprot:1175722-Prorocentrum_minimum.AAC.3
MLPRLAPSLHIHIHFIPTTNIRGAAAFRSLARPHAVSVLSSTSAFSAAHPGVDESSRRGAEPRRNRERAESGRSQQADPPRSQQADHPRSQQADHP